VLTHPLLLAVFAYRRQHLADHRGVFISRSIFGRMAAATSGGRDAPTAGVHADLTTRERVPCKTQAQSCMSCHEYDQPVGIHAGAL